jgi:endo-1,4-beta-xylanase
VTSDLPMLNRRQSLVLALSLGTVACTQEKILSPMPAPLAGSPAQSGGSLASLAKQKGMRFGSALGAKGAGSGSFRNPAYARLLEADCSILVPENEMKWQAIRPSPTAYDFADFDGQVAFAKARGMAMRGHTLLWHRPRWMPKWAETYDYGANPASEAARLLTDHINTVCARYRGTINSYDVVNETVMEDGTLAATALSKAMGGTLPLVDLAFHTAREQAPGAQLVYNDYMSWEPGNEKHRNGVLKLLEGFKARGVPVDALGLQSHIRIDSLENGVPAKQEREWLSFLNEVTAMGYELLITEFDVNDQVAPADITKRDQMVADYAKSYLDVMFSFPQLKDVLAWGMCDSYSWLQSFEPLRADGLAKRSCPYDASFAKKPLWDAIAKAFAAAPAR